MTDSAKLGWWRPRDEIEALQAALAKAEVGRDKARKSRDGWHAVACADAGKLAAAEARISTLEALLAECETIVEHILSGYLDDSRARALLAKLKARTGDKA